MQSFPLGVTFGMLAMFQLVTLAFFFWAAHLLSVANKKNAELRAGLIEQDRLLTLYRNRIEEMHNAHPQYGATFVSASRPSDWN